MAKWKKRPDVTDRKTGPSEPKSTSLSIEEEANIVSTYGAAHVVATYHAMRAANDGSADDIADLQNGLSSRSITFDTIHPTSAGRAVLAQVIHGAMVDAGYLPGTTSVPDRPVHQSQSTTSTTYPIDWTAPAEDGGHPLQAYQVAFRATAPPPRRSSSRNGR